MPPKKQCESDHVETIIKNIGLHRGYFDSQFELFKQNQEHIVEKLEKVETQTTKTNGRVNKLEAARDRMLGRRQGFIFIGKVLAWGMGTLIPLLIGIWYIVDKLK